MPSTQHPDNDPTDELPVLSDVALAEIESATATAVDDTGARTLEIPGPPPRTAADPGAASLGSLERDVAELNSRWGRLENQFAESAAAVAALSDQLTSAQQALSQSAAGRQRLNRELDDKDRQLVALRDQYSQLRHDNAALREAVDRFTADKEALSSQLAAAREDSGARAELDAQLTQRRALEAELEQARTRVADLECSQAEQLEQARARAAGLEAELAAAEQLIDELAPAPRADGDVDAYRAEIAALSDYITNRRSYWDDMEAHLASQRERIAELEAEVEHRSERQQASEQTAQREAALAAELKERLSQMATQLEADRAEDAASKHGPASAAATDTPRLQELEQQLRATRAELGTRERQLAEAENDAAKAIEKLNALGRELAEARADAENVRAQLHVLEEQLAERDQETDLHKERIAQLQRQLDAQLDDLRELAQQHGDGSDDPAAPDAANGKDMNAMLVCLTSEQPQEYTIAKPVMTIGRGGQCDIQILTHFVSREHARLLAGPDGIAIEDLGSTNGVFVNSVRVARQPLHHGDWITIGETQFRFLNGART